MGCERVILGFASDGFWILVGFGSGSEGVGGEFVRRVREMCL